jgi:hypothetical protein
MSKEEILSNHEYKVYYFSGGRERVLQAMEEYAKQVNSEAIDLLRTIYVKNRHDMGLDEDISSFFEKIGEEL